MAWRGASGLAFLIGASLAPSLSADLQIRVQETSPQGRIITTEHRHTEYPDRPLSAAQEIATDGWYLDIPGPLPVLTRVGQVTYLSVSGRRGRINRPRIEVTRTGPVPRGLAVWEKTGDDLKEVTEFSEAPLDPKLFEIPEGFRRVMQPFPGQPLSWSDQLIVDWQEFQDWLSRLL